MSAALVAGILLCGGRSQRMGLDKAFLPQAGEHLLTWQIRRLLPCVSQLVVAAGWQQPLPPLPPQILVHHDREPFPGPLAAIAAAWSFLAANTPPLPLFVLGVDMVGFEPRLLTVLLALIGDCEAVVCRSAGQPQPLAALYHPAARSKLSFCLHSGERALHQWLSHLRVRWVEEEEWLAAGVTRNCFLNLNTWADYKEWCSAVT